MSIETWNDEIKPRPNFSPKDPWKFCKILKALQGSMQTDLPNSILIKCLWLSDCIHSARIASCIRVSRFAENCEKTRNERIACDACVQPTTRRGKEIFAELEVLFSVFIYISSVLVCCECSSPNWWRKEKKMKIYFMNISNTLKPL